MMMISFYVTGTSKAEQKCRNIHLNDKYFLKIANISLKARFPRDEIPKFPIISMHGIKMMMISFDEIGPVCKLRVFYFASFHTICLLIKVSFFVLRSNASTVSPFEAFTKIIL